LLYRERTSDIVARLLGAPLFALGPGDLLGGVEEIPQAGLTLGEIRVSIRTQERHNHPTLALRVDDALTYCTDTAYDEGNIDFALGSACLLHEAWFTEKAPRDQATHCSAAGAARVAQQAGVRRLVLIHVRPEADTRPLVAEARREFQATTLGEDLMSVFPARS
jgi:ribonuclease BN (tRNA processing enzyme)